MLDAGGHAGNHGAADPSTAGGPRRNRAMLNLLIVLLGVLILALSIFLGIVAPVSRATLEAARGRVGPDGRPVTVPGRHITGGVLGALVGAFILLIGLSCPLVE